MIKKSAVALLIVTLLAYAFLQIVLQEAEVAYSYLFVSMLLLINYLGLSMMWRHVFVRRKSGAVTVFALLKYPLIATAIFWAGRQTWINTLGVLIGICSFLVIIVVTLLIKNSSKKTVGE